MPAPITPHQTYFNWSTGKDASLALYYLQKNSDFKVDRLLTSVNSHHNRVTMHGLRRELLEAQAQAIGLPLQTIELPEMLDMETYNQLMSSTVQGLTSNSYTHAAFGDIFLEDLRAYRDEQLHQVGMQTEYPLWKRNTTELAHELIDLGFRTIVVCIDGRLLDESFVGREFTKEFLNDLPQNVDPCGENGEFHTFCFDGPIFNHPVKFELAEKTYREYPAPQKNAAPAGFWFQELKAEE